MPTAGGPSAFLRTGSIAITGTGQLDLQRADLLLDYSGAAPMSQVVQYLHNGRLGTGPRIVAAGTTPDGHPAALVAADNEQIHQTMWKSQTLSDGVNFSQVVIKYTYLGDTNMDGQVDQTDLFDVIGNMGRSGASVLGDVNLDGIVTVADRALVLQNMGAGTGSGMGL